MAGIDFGALLTGKRLADQDNWADIRNMQNMQTYELQREDALAKRDQQRINRDATAYLSTVLPNLQRLADNGVDPIDALIEQRASIMNHDGFKAFSPEVQAQIINQLSETAKLRMQTLANAGDYAGVERLTAAFGGSSPLDPIGVAIASGNTQLVIDAINKRAPNTVMLSPDRQWVIDMATGNQTPTSEYVARVAAARSASGGFSAFQQQDQIDRTQGRADDLKQDQARQQLALLRAQGINIDPSVFGLPGIEPTQYNASGAMPGVIAGFQSTEMPGVVPAAATPAAALPGPTGVMPALPAPGAEQQTNLQQMIAGMSTEQLRPQLAGVQQLIEQSKVQQQALAQRKALLEQQRQQLSQQFNRDEANPFVDSSKSPTVGYLRALEQELGGIDQQFEQITEQMQGLGDLAKQINLQFQLNNGPLATNRLSELMLQNVVASSQTPEAARLLTGGAPAVAASHVAGLTQRYNALADKTTPEAQQIVRAIQNLQRVGK